MAKPAPKLPGTPPRSRLSPAQRAVKALAARARRLGIPRHVVASKLRVSVRQLYRYLHARARVPYATGRLAASWRVDAERQADGSTLFRWSLRF